MLSTDRKMGPCGLFFFLLKLGRDPPRDPPRKLLEEPVRPFCGVDSSLLFSVRANTSVSCQDVAGLLESVGVKLDEFPSCLGSVHHIPDLFFGLESFTFLLFFSCL